MKRLLLLMLAILSLSVGNAKLYKGDMDYNGIINVADLTKLVSVIMGTTDQYSIPADTIYTDDSIYVAKDGIMGDMDGNSTVNVADLTSLVSVIMGLKEAEDVDREAFPNKEYEYVDLELPSGTLWAKYNIGAERETDYGNYFAWGETVGYNEGKKDFFIESYKWSDGSSSYNAFTKYVTNDVYGTVDSLSTLLPEDDAARVLWGKKWCIPSSEQLKELVDEKYVTITTTTLNGCRGTKFTSRKNGKYIFIPAAGYYEGTSLKNVTSYTHIWSNSILVNEPRYAEGLNFSIGYSYRFSSISRHKGANIRPVLAKEFTPMHYVDSIRFANDPMTLKWGRTDTIKVEVNEDARNKKLTWTSSDSTIVSVTQEGVVTALAPGTVIITATATDDGHYSKGCEVTVPRPIPDTHDAIDLGLPSGTLWAANNIGAETDAECGSHFAWGETETKETYDWANYKHCNGTYKTITKYNGWDYYGPTIDDKEILDAEDDAAQATWGENWQMPSQENFLELLDTTLISREWVITPEFTGYIFTSKINGNQLRLPAAGYRFDKYMLDGFGLYWSKTRGGKYESSSAYSLHFEPDTVLNETTPRYYGCAIRPVAVDGYKPFHAVTYIKLSSNTVSLGMLQTKMVYATVNANAPIKDLTWVSSNPEVATVDNSGLITGVGFGTATITITANDGYGATATIQVVVEKKENETHGSIDLGLPSGTIWATCNVGAETDAERGDLYSWGEITGTKEGKTTFNWANYSLSKGTSSTITKYNSSKYYGDVDNLSELEDADDVAKAVWGKNWRMPSAAQIKELLDSTLTKQEYVSNSNFKGYVITSLINGKQIRIPTAGYKWSSTDGKDYDMTTYGAYWSRETGEYSVYAQSIKANSLEISLNQDTRAYGLSVRPVAEKDYTPYYYVTKITLPMEELTLEQDDKFIIKPQIDECATIKTLTWTISNPSIASIDENGIITAHGVGTTTLTVTSCDGGNVSATCKITVTPAHTLQPGEHDYVSLGLPSGTKWATCNIGANDYTEAGDFISWGETTGSQAGKTTFDVASYTLCNGSLTSMKKYIAESYYGTVDNLKKLESSDDAASVNWGADWCIPTATQVEELINPEYTTCEFTTLPNGFVGIVITSLINDKKLYLPIGGYRFSTYTMGTSYYWTSELENTIYAKILSFSRGGTPTMDKATRYYGATIRPVKK